MKVSMVEGALIRGFGGLGSDFDTAFQTSHMYDFRQNYMNLQTVGPYL